MDGRSCVTTKQSYKKQVRVCVNPFLKQQLDLFRDYESEEIGIGRFPLRTVCVHGSSWILAVSGTLSLSLGCLTAMATVLRPSSFSRVQGCCSLLES